MSRHLRRINGILNDISLSRASDIRRKAGFMAHFDEQGGIPYSALGALPVLLLPMVLGAGILILWPGLATGTAAVVFSTIAVAWYLLGGMLSLAHGRRSLASRRALALIRTDAMAAEDPIWVSDSAGQVMLQNNAARERFGDIVGQPILTLLTRLRADAATDMTDMISRAAYTANVEMQLADGDVFALTSAPDSYLRVWSHHPAGRGLPIQINEERTDEAADDFEVMPVALLKIGGDGYVRRANREARRLLGSTLNAQQDGPLQIGLLLEGPGRSVGDWIADAVAGRLEYTSEILRGRMSEQRKAEGGKEEYFQVSLAIDPVEESGVIAVIHDASALKTLEAQFVQSQKMQAIGQLAGGVAHDFNNLLTAIRGHCDLLMLRHDKGDPDYADLDQIGQNANRAAALVGQLLAFSRKQTLKLETLDLRDTLADLAHLLNRLVGERVALTIINDPAVKRIRADKGQLEQVIMNLVVNARDAIPDGGEIGVRTANVQLNEPMIRDRVTVAKGEYVRIEVCDEGTGIKPELLNKIFEPFFSTKGVGEGTGLGLSTAYGIVKQTGGYIFCDSTLGEGTVFSIYLPAHHYASVPEAKTSRMPVAEFQPRHNVRPSVLLVEDEAPVRAFAGRALRLKGYEVHEAENAEAALDLLSDTDLTVDVFVTDVVMPGMDGPTWVREALKQRPKTKIVFMSGYTDDIFAEGHAPIPNSAFLAKPFTLNELAQMVAQQLAAPETPIH